MKESEQVVRPLLADARSGAHVPAGAERFFVDVFDGGVVGRVFGQVDEVVLVHGRQKPFARQ